MQKCFYFDRSSLLLQNTLFTEDAEAKLLQAMNKILIIGEIRVEVEVYGKDII